MQLPLLIVLLNTFEIAISQEFKALENNISIDETKESTSNKCGNPSHVRYKLVDGDNATPLLTHSFLAAEIKDMVSNLMGVSTANLENVIFCHQEDANW